MSKVARVQATGGNSAIGTTILSKGDLLDQSESAQAGWSTGAKTRPDLVPKGRYGAPDEMSRPSVEQRGNTVVVAGPWSSDPSSGCLPSRTTMAYMRINACPFACIGAETARRDSVASVEDGNHKRHGESAGRRSQPSQKSSIKNPGWHNSCGLWLYAPSHRNMGGVS